MNPDKAPGLTEKRISSSLNRFHAEAATSAIENAGVNYQAPSLVSAGVGAQGVSLMAFFANLAISFFAIKAPGIIERINSKKKAITYLALFSTISWVPIIAVFIFSSTVNPAIIILLWVLSLVPTGLITPLRDGWLTDLVPKETLGRYFGTRAVITNISYLFTFFLMANMLDRFSGQVFHGYATILSVAFVAALLSYALYRKIAAPPARDKKATEFTFVDLAREMPGGSLGALILFIGLFMLAVHISSPLFAYYMLKDLHFTYVTFSLIVSAEYLARIASAHLWGKYIDSASGLKILGVICRLIPFVPILWLFSANIFYIMTIQLISGILWAGFDLCSQTYICKAAPPDKRLKYLYYHRSLITLAMAFGALGGAYLVNVMTPVFGSRILGLFLLSGISRLAVVTLMFHRLIDLTWTPSRLRRQPATALSVFNTNMTKKGLLYQPEQWLRHLKESAPGIKAAAKKMLFHQPEQWTRYLRESSPRIEAASGVIAAKKAVFHQPEQWTRYLRESSPRIEAASGIIAAKKAVFHQPEQWARYRQEPSPRIGAASGVIAAKKALFHQPEQWARYLREPSPPTKVKKIRSLSPRLTAVPVLD